MASSPVQIVLNSDAFRTIRERGGGGRSTDFFIDSGAEFAAHKSALQSQLGSVAQVLERQPDSPIGYLKINLRRSAWAKSHRPTRSLFKPDQTPVVGGGDLGQMIVEITPDVTRRLRSSIDDAEVSTNWQTLPGQDKQTPNPSRLKSEVGAIEKFELYGPSDRRKFEIEEGIEWLSRPNTGGSYRVELFDSPPQRSDWDILPAAKRALFDSFTAGLIRVGRGLVAEPRWGFGTHAPMLTVRLEKSEAPPRVRLLPAPGSSREVALFDDDRERHSRLLKFLEGHPLVRRIELPGIVVRSIEASAGDGVEQYVVPAPVEGDNYPILGVIDGGLSGILSDWVIGEWRPLAENDQDVEHGTFIGGLAIVGGAINGGHGFLEPDGASLVDIAVHPREDDPNAFTSYYPNGMVDFLDEVESAVQDSRTRHNARVFNFSLNMQHAVSLDHYSAEARRLDQIADENDVIIVISAGNLDPSICRGEWSDDIHENLAELASRRDDGVFVPSESIRNVSVAALNAPGAPMAIDYAPARYSRRGPGLRAGMKPDLAHIGGVGPGQPDNATMLRSLRSSGEITHGCGTSYAAPLIAKTLAGLDHAIEGDVSRETLLALTTHHATVPGLLSAKAISEVVRHMVGFGMPATVENMLAGNDDQITLVFASRLHSGQELRFDFAWPSPLVADNGKCRGKVKMSLAASPPLDTRFGAEFVRVNLNAALQQEHINPAKTGSSWRGQLKPTYLPGGTGRKTYEAEQIEYGLKWSPIKTYSTNMPGGRGNSSNWRLVVDYLARSGEVMPEAGVPFTVVLTISDPAGETAIFEAVRQNLQAVGVQISDIRTAARIVPRV